MFILHPTYPLYHIISLLFFLNHFEVDGKKEDDNEYERKSKPKERGERYFKI